MSTGRRISLHINPENDGSRRLVRRLLSLLVIFSCLPACEGEAGSAEGGEADMQVSPERGAAPPSRRDRDLPLEDMRPDEEDRAPVEDQDAPVEEKLCEPCQDDSECGEGGICLTLGNLSFCGSACEQSSDCPDDFLCGATEQGVDQCIPASGTCLGEGDGCDDLDGDGYGLGVDCVDADCNDNDGSVHIGAVDVCDNKDQDCDGNFDEDFEATSCGIGACAATSTCTEGVEFSCQPGDALNEEDATCDGVDDDCDERVDEGYVPESCGNGPCIAESSCVDGAVQDCTPNPPPVGVDSTCDGVDDDCDGTIDDDFAPGRCGEGVCAADEVCVDGEISCTPGAPQAEDDTNCNGIDEDCEGGPDDDYSSDATCGVGACVAGFQCIDGSSACVELMPLSELDETCDGIDDNCNGLVDEDCGRNYLRYRLKAEETTSEVMAVEVYYEQETSPSPDAINPLLLQPEAVELQLVINSMQMLPQSENFVTLSEPVVSAGKLLEWFQFEDETGAQIDGNYLVRIVRPNAGPGANSRIPPGSLLTLYFERVAPAGPYSLEWGPFPEGRTSFLPLEPSGRALVPEAAELDP